MDTKNEIKEIFKNYKISIEKISNDKDIQLLMQNIEKHIPTEKPDAYLRLQNTVYAIEHFQISQYDLVKKNQDISRIAKGSKDRRDKMKEDRDFDYKPSIDNLIKALKKNICAHSKSFIDYKKHILGIKENENKEYRLAILIEDSTESAYIVKKGDTQFINPLLLQQIADIFWAYKEDIWGIIYVFGNEVQKWMTGYTLEELDEKRKKGFLLDAKDYVPFEVERNVHVSKSKETEDTNKVTIKICDCI